MTISNQIATDWFTPAVYVDPYPGKDENEAVFLTCDRCLGTGHLVGFEHIDGGICYGCMGLKGTDSTVGQERKREKARIQRSNREARKTLRQQEAHNDRIAAYEAQYPELATWLELVGEDNFLSDLWVKAFDYDLTDKQVAAAAKAITRKAEWAAKKDAEKAAQAALPPAPTGKVEVSGTVKSVKYHENQFGGSWKMIVEGPEGWRVWATVPSKIIDAAMEEQAARDSSEDEEFVGWSDFIVGRGITFTATLEASHDDKAFAFAKRPTKAALK